MFWTWLRRVIYRSRLGGELKRKLLVRIFFTHTLIFTDDISRSLYNKYGPCVDLLLGKDRFLLVNDPDFCKAVMKSTDRGLVNGEYRRDFRSRFLMMELWGRSDIDLFIRSNAIGDWKSRRRILHPAFDQKHVRAMQPDLSSSVHRLIEKLASVSEEKGSFDVLPVLQDFTLDFILKSSLGVSLDLTEDNSKGRWIIDIINLQCKLFAEYQFDPFLRLKVGLLAAIGLNPMELKRREGALRLRSFTKELLEKEKKRQTEHTDISTTGSEGSGPVNGDSSSDTSSLLSIMVASSVAAHKSKEGISSGLSDEDVTDELLSFMFAGYDTTSVTLSILLHHLATHPAVQQRLRGEIDLVLADATTQVAGSSEELDLAELLKVHPLTFLSACIRESQRIQPIVPALMRRTEQAIELKMPSMVSEKLDGLDNKHKPAGAKTKTLMVPKGTKVFVPVFLLQRNKAYYENPDEFKPERWLEGAAEGEKKTGGGVRLKHVPTGAFYAFGGGPKACIGIQLAEKELKMTAIAMLASFSVQSAGDVKITDTFITGPESVRIRLTRRGHL